MKNKTFIFAVGAAAVLAFTSAISFAAEKQKSTDAGKSSVDAKFIKKAANGGMTEVELDKIAAKNGQKDEVKSFGERMVKDHAKANDGFFCRTVATPDLSLPNDIKFTMRPAGIFAFRGAANPNSMNSSWH